MTFALQSLRVSLDRYTTKLFRSVIRSILHDYNAVYTRSYTDIPCKGYIRDGRHGAGTDRKVSFYQVVVVGDDDTITRFQQEIYNTGGYMTGIERHVTGYGKTIVLCNIKGMCQAC